MITKKKNRVLKIIAITLAALIILFSAASLILVQSMLSDTFSRAAAPQYGLTSKLLYDDVADSYEREEVSFMSGENRLYGHLYGTDNSEGLVVIAHGLGGGEGSYLSEALYFIDCGYMVLCYSNTGCWDSEGESCIGLNQSVLDLDAALTWVESESRFDNMPVFLYGHSWGGYAVASIFHFDHNITASVSVAGFNKALPMISEWGSRSIGSLAYIETPFIWINQKFTFGSVSGLTAVDALNSTDTPVLIVHGNNDDTVGFDTVSIIAQRERITNPNVRYLVRGSEPQNGHSTLFQSLACIEYSEKLYEEYDALSEQYGGDVPESVQREFCSRADKRLASQPDGDFMASVVNFYREAVR